MSAAAWEREFWGAVELILKMQGESLETWLGASNSQAPMKLIQQATEATEWAVKNRINRHKDDFEAKFSSESKRVQERTKATSALFSCKNWDAEERSECPACGSLGFVAGNFWDEEIVESEEADHFQDERGEWHSIPGSETVEKTFRTEYFECPICALKLESTKEIAAGNLEVEFSIKEVREREFEPDYGND